MLIDLHCHSTASDGALSPQALVERADAMGVGLLALTDHDTLAGMAPAAERARELGLQFVTGIELSTQWARRNLHLVGLGIDLDSTELADLLQSQEQARDQRAREIGWKLEKLGFPGAYAGARMLAGESTVGRPHFARWLVRTQGVDSEEEAFRRYLGNGKPCDISSHWPALATAVAAVRDAGGVPVLAHPCKYQLSWSKLRGLLGDFVEAGGLGMEVSYGGERPDHCRYLNELARQFDLEASVGSDFHSPAYAWSELGRYPRLKSLHRPVWLRWLPASSCPAINPG